MVDGHLQMLETGPVKPLDALRRQQIAVGDDGGNHVVGMDRPSTSIPYWVEGFLIRKTL